MAKTSDKSKFAKNLMSCVSNARDHLVKLLAKKWQACKIYFQNLFKQLSHTGGVTNFQAKKSPLSPLFFFSIGP